MSDRTTTIKAAICLSLATILGACTAHNTASVVDPTARSLSISRIIAYADKNAPLAEQEAMETAMVERLRANGIDAVRGIDIAPPTRDRADRIAAITRSGYPYILFAMPAGKETTSTYVPPTYHPGTTYTNVSVYGRTAYATSYTTPGYTTGGYNVQKPNAGYFFGLADANVFTSRPLSDTGKPPMLWEAEVSAHGSAFHDYQSLARSSSHEAVDRMKKDGLIGQPVKSNSTPAPETKQ